VSEWERGWIELKVETYRSKSTLVLGVSSPTSLTPKDSASRLGDVNTPLEFVFVCSRLLIQ